jgi:hypothetical protein
VGTSLIALEGPSKLDNSVKTINCSMKSISKFFAVFTPFLLVFPSICFSNQFTVTRVYDGDTINGMGRCID